MKYFAYILFSATLNKFYYGHTNNLENRLAEHNRGKERFTKGGIPWKLHYFEVFDSKLEAARRERYFKTIDGYNFLRRSGIIQK
jgi:putative endonuclease